MGGTHSRRKGHGFERELAVIFREAGFPMAARQLEYCLNDCKGVDLQGTLPYLIQSKCTKNYVSINTIEEIQLDKFPEDSVPVLISKADRKRPVAVLYLDDFMDMVKALKDQESYFTEKGDTNTI